MAKFKKKPFREWLDFLAKIVVKARDNYTCQIQHNGCQGRLNPLDKNCQWCHIKSRTGNDLRWDLLNALTGCGQCHAWAHANPTAFGVWFKEKYPHRYEYINQRTTCWTWREADYLRVEKVLLEKVKDLKIKPECIPSRYRKRLINKLREI